MPEEPTEKTAPEKSVTEKTVWERNHEAIDRLDQKGELYHDPSEPKSPSNPSTPST